MPKNINHSDVLIKEMFKRVNVEYIPENYEGEEWYMNHSWTEEEQTNFQNWGIEYLRKKTRATKKHATTQMAYFILNYGWVTKKNN